MPRARTVETMVEIGLIETMRTTGWGGRRGRIPWLDRHVARLRASLAALGAPHLPDDVVGLVRSAAGRGDSGDRVIRLQVTAGHAQITTRDVSTEREISVVVSQEVHQPYPHKTTRRDQFGRALAGARQLGSADALLVTADGYVAEGTAWNLFWWDDARLCTPAAELGILSGIGRRRVMELADVTELRVPVEALRGRCLFLVNAVRGIVEIAGFQGEGVPRDRRTAELSASFWPD
jgi:branched-subunit amino acid aminotransferase/4-amino-4-deoxychorismate lyase